MVKMGIMTNHLIEKKLEGIPSELATEEIMKKRNTVATAVNEDYHQKQEIILEEY